MRFDPEAKKPLLEEYPYLDSFEEFKGDDKKLRFVIYLLDPESPLYQESDLNRRIQMAANKTGLKKVSLDDPQIETMICRYFILVNNDTFELWLSKKIAFGDCNHQIRASVDHAKDPIKAMETKLKVSSLAETLRTDILKLERILFKGTDIDKKIKESFDNRTLHYAELYAEKNSVL